MNQKELKTICKILKKVPIGYTELCQRLGIEQIKSGSTSQVRQLNELKQYCDIEKIGRKYILSNYRSTPTPYQDTSGHHNKLMDLGLTKTESKRHGVYMIYNIHNVAYIGSSMQPFLNIYTRLQREERVGEVMNIQHDFKILYMATENDTKQILKERENFFIKDLQKQGGYDIINIRESIEYKYLGEYIKFKQSVSPKDKDDFEEQFNTMILFCKEKDLSFKSFIQMAINYFKSKESFK